jgi:hypothetical protein
MRHLLETDRQLAGNFTSYSPTLERVLLKKDRYLAGPAAEPPSAPPAPPAKPPAAQATAPPAKINSPKSGSLFGDKLLQALQPADGKGEG